jgi:hypothetical protein
VVRSAPQESFDASDKKWKLEQEKQCRKATIANTTGLRVLTAIAAAVQLRLMTRPALRGQSSGVLVGRDRLTFFVAIRRSGRREV